MDEPGGEFVHLLIPVDKSPGGAYVAVFSDDEVIQRNNGEPLMLEIEETLPVLRAMNESRLYSYFEKMVELLSLMCMTRNYPGINALTPLYPLDFCIECLFNENVPELLRANFAKLILHCHINKDPFEMLNVPNMARLWSDISSAKTSIP